MENVWFNQRLKMLDNSLELLKEDKEEISENDDDDVSSCARCRIYQRKKKNDTQLFEKIKHIYQIHREHNYSNTQIPYSSPGFSSSLNYSFDHSFFLLTESDLISSLSKLADRIGHISTPNVSNSSKKLSSTTIKKKQPPPPKFQSSMSVIVGDSNKLPKRTSEDSRHLSNSNFISTNYDLTNKRQKRIGKKSIHLFLYDKSLF